jgi:hypothetical protein
VRFVPTFCVRKIFWPHTIGVLLPRSGSSIFHFTPSVALNFSGRSVSGVVPSAAGPRHAGQLPAKVEVTRVRNAKRVGVRSVKG